MFFWGRLAEPASGDSGASRLAGLGVPFGRSQVTVEEWRSACGSVRLAWVRDPWAVGGDLQRSRVDGQSAVLVAGRPILWSRSGSAQGVDAGDVVVTPHSVTVHGVPVEDADLDGRFCLVVARSDGILVVTDPVGLSPVYLRQVGDASAISNVASVISEPTDSCSRDIGAEFLLTGHSPRLAPLNTRVRRVASGTRLRILPHGQTVQSRRRVASGELEGGPDAREAARLLTSAVEAMLHGGTRSSAIQLSGGYDSRLVLAASRTMLTKDAITLAFEGEAGFPLTADLELSRVLAETTGLRHRVSFVEAPSEDSLDFSLAVLDAFSPGCISAQELNPLRLAPEPGTVYLDGVGGELGRDAFGNLTPGGEGDVGSAGPESRERVVRALMTGLVPHPGRALVKPEFVRGLRDWVADGVTELLDLGVRSDELSSVFILRYVAGWHGPKTGIFDFYHDACSPLLVTPLWPHFAGQDATDRGTARLQREMVRLMMPELDEVPYGSRGTVQQDRRERARNREWLAHRRRCNAIMSQYTGRAPHPLSVLRARVRDVVGSTGSDLLETVDRDRLAVLLEMDLARADYEDASQLWRLLTMFSVESRSWTGDMPESGW